MAERVRNIGVLFQGQFIAVIDERPFREIPGGHIGIAYQRRVYRVYELGDLPFILLENGSYDKSECPATARRPHVASEEAECNEVDLTDFDFQRLQRIWINCLRCLDDGQKSHAHGEARVRLAQIESEWCRRFPWPSTDAPPGNGRLDEPFHYPEGMLSFLGYRVGVTRGERESLRRRILDRVFSGVLPPLNDRAYMAEWSKPESEGRLKKTADSIATFCRNAKRNARADQTSAVAEWEDDLAYLYKKYYVGYFGFVWPPTDSLSGRAGGRFRH